MKASMLSQLKSLTLFAGLTEEELQSLVDHVIVRALPKNTVVIVEGDRTDSLYVLLSGKVKVYASDTEGREIVLGTQEAGDYFGEMALDDGPRSASVMTLEPSRFALIPKSDFQTFIARYPEIAVHIMKNLIHRARVLTENVKSLALLDVYGRVARLLLELAKEQAGKLVISEPLTQQEMANRIGASREMVSRILTDLHKGGYIEVADRKITINKKPPPRW